MLPHAFVLALALGAFANAHAHDLGTVSHVYPIVEIDVRELLVSQASDVDQKKIDAQRKEALDRFLNTLPSRTLPSPNLTAVRYFDPSITLERDIHAPVKQANGEWKWQLLFPKGMRVNPLTKQKPPSAYLIFDASSKAQLAFVKQALAKAPAGRIEPLDVSGRNPVELAKAVGRHVFVAPDHVLSRFSIEKSPSFVYAAEGDRDGYIAIVELAAPYRWEELTRWSVLKQKGAPK